ncbi:hypothetical protein ES288_D12G022300v1 [Gossypium darwinii]|uniref:ZFPL1-like U-box domain-containing protein n=1 Tax=Gossypium darwinii TaxID=34276 RepID=A0A5D2A593_GOSDA|nr:hypothetical protein ES288_D12G022300v1 [Gossypium darwinii]
MERMTGLPSVASAKPFLRRRLALKKLGWVAYIWPPKSVKDSASRLHSLLKDAVMQTGMEKNLFGNHPVSLNTPEPSGPPPAIMRYNGNSSASVAKDEGYSAVGPPKISVSEIMEIDSPSSAGNYMKTSSPVAPIATTRKGTVHADRQNSEISYYVTDDEDGNRKKYSRRGSLRHKFFRALIPFWSSALPSLPVTAPPRKDASNADDIPEGRLKHQRPTRMDPRKILLVIAIMACVATMGILYYRIAQRVVGEGDLGNDEQAAQQ